MFSQSECFELSIHEKHDVDLGSLENRQCTISNKIILLITVGGMLLNTPAGFTSTRWGGANCCQTMPETPGTSPLLFTLNVLGYFY